MKQYLSLWLTVTATLLMTIAAINFVVDPYGLFRVVDSPGFNAIKPKSGAHGAIVKAYQVLRVRPRALMLGNSRAEVGFDPEYPAWPMHKRPVFNMALPGTGTSTSLRYLQHVLANADRGESAKPELVVWGIDFMDFLTDTGVPERVGSANREYPRLLTNPDGSRNPARGMQQVRDYGEALFTLGAFLDSIQTLGSQKDPYSADLTPLGFNPMNDYIKITADEGYWAVFRQKDIENTKAFLRQPKDIYDAAGRSSPALDDLRQILRLCRQHSIVLHLVIYPYHAHLLETIRITGHWPAFEAWKRAVVQIVTEESRSVGGAPVPLWDFSGFNELSTEVIPPKGNRQEKMRWYWEAGHFKRELGDLILARILGHTETNTRFGVLLNTENIDAQIAAMQAQEANYRRNFPKDVEALERIAADIQSRK